MAVVINGRNLTMEEAIRVSREGEKVELSKDAAFVVRQAREYVDRKVEEGEVVYGITTGFGKFSDTLIDRENVKSLQRNLIISHACSMGNPLSAAVVRMTMLLRCNALASGHSGIRLQTLETLMTMLNRGVHPVIPEKGSLGASGDLAPLAHMVLVMIGEGEAEYQGEVLPGRQAMEKARIEIVELEAKEGLALINGTQVMTAIGLETLWDAIVIAKTADIAAAMTGEALNAITKAYDHKIQRLRGHRGQEDVAWNMRTLLAGSKKAMEHNKDKVQDPYSLRCIPQVHGATRDAIEYVSNAVKREINAVTDNPIIFHQEDEVISGGNFHGQPMALAFDFLKIAISEIGNISERRIERLVNPQLSEGLAPFLTKHGGVCSGFMIAQYVAASMVSENKVYAHPASVDSIPSSANQEDHVSMGTTSARTAAMVLDNVQKIIGIELMAASQGIWLRGVEGLAKPTKSVYEYIRKTVDPVDEDIVMNIELCKVNDMVRKGEILKVAQGVTGPLR